MTEIDSELKSRLVVGSKRDGRRRYSVEAKQELVAACLKPGISVARMAYEHGVNANLLRKWITQYQGGGAIATDAPGPVVPAFVPVVQINKPAAATHATALEAHLPNGVIIKLSEAGDDERAAVLRLLWALPCSGSTQG
jgi:transposase-like protein